MINIANYQRYANQNCNEVSPHTQPSSKNLQTISTGGCGEKETPYTVGGNVNWYTTRTVKTKIIATIRYSNPTCGQISEENNDLKDTCTPMSTAALSTIVKTGKQTKCLSTDE